jgi:TRAP-type C4-dicarboxylate transport system permease small subunit
MRMNEKNSFYQQCETGINRIASWMTLLSGLLLLVAVTITIVSITGRAFSHFGLSSVPGDYELEETFIGLAVFSFMPYCQLVRGHVGVDIFIQPFGNRAMNFTQLLGDIVLLGLSCLITWRHYLGTIDKYNSNETSFILGFPIWWGYAAAAVLLIPLCVTCAFTVWRDVRELNQNKVFTGTAGGH